MSKLIDENRPGLSACQRQFDLRDGAKGRFYSLPTLAEISGAPIARLPVSLRVVLESLMRNCDGKAITEDHVKALAAWKPREPRNNEIPFVVARIIIPDSSGVP